MRPPPPPPTRTRWRRRRVSVATVSSRPASIPSGAGWGQGGRAVPTPGRARWKVHERGRCSSRLGVGAGWQGGANAGRSQAEGERGRRCAGLGVGAGRQGGAGAGQGTE
ncbi:hypothetical protein ABZP36_011472 [Zizania latifolia]